MAYRSVRRSIPDLDQPNSRRHQSASGDRPKMSAWASTSPELNLVICGSDADLKASVFKLFTEEKTPSLLYQNEFNLECVMAEEEIHGHLISLVLLPALTQLSEEELMHQTLKCVSLCDPGVHAFILIASDSSLTDGDKAEIEKIQKMFDSREHVILLLTSDPSTDENEKESTNSSPESQMLIDHCRGQYRMRLKVPENSRQIPDLLDYIKNMKTEPYSLQMYVKSQENRVKRELEEAYKEELKNKINKLQQKTYSEDAESRDQKCLRILLFGKTGSGKSATGNTILGREEFHSQMSSDSVSSDCQRGVGEVDGRSIAVIDTPGFFDTTLTNEQAVEEIVKCVTLSSPGPHVFVIVLNVGQFNQVDMDAVDQIKKIFGNKMDQFSIVLFTRGDELENTLIQQHVEKSEDLKKLLRNCGNRLLVFNNREKHNRTQVIQLLTMIEELKNTNESRYFTNSMFEEAEMSIKKRMEQILKEKEREIQAQNEKLRVRYETEMRELIKRLEEEKRNADEERIQRENELRQKGQRLLKDLEEKHEKDQRAQEINNKKLLKLERQQMADYQRKIEELKREIKNQRTQYEKQQKEREEELQMRIEKEIKIRDLEEKRRNEEEEEERRRWKRKIEEAESDKKEIQEEIKQQQIEWENEKKLKMREIEDEERKRKQIYEEQLREKQEELEKMRKKFEREREDRQMTEDEKQKQRREQKEKEREHEEQIHDMKRHYVQLERERKEEWERRKQDDDKRHEEERKSWKEMIENLKQDYNEKLKSREREEKERKEREEKAQNEIKQIHEEEIKKMEKEFVKINEDLKWKHREEVKRREKEEEDRKEREEKAQNEIKQIQAEIKEREKNCEFEAKKQAEEFNYSNERKLKHVLELTEMLKEHQKQNELLDTFYKLMKEQKEEEIKELKQEVEKQKNKTGCVIQ